MQILQSLLDKLPTAAYLCDPSGLITHCNGRALELWGRAPRLNDPSDRYCGSLRLYSSDGAPMSHERCWMALALHEEREQYGLEVVIERPDGRRVSALAYASPLHDDAGKLLGAVNVLIDISAHKDMQAALRESEQAQKIFLAMLAHELRNPLHSLRSAVAALRLDDSAPQASRNACELVERQVAQLSHLIDDLVDVSRVTRNELEIRPEPLELSELFSRALEATRPIVAKREHELEISLPPERVWLLADPVRLVQGLSNLLDNAARYTARNGHLRLSARVAPDGDGDELVVSVSDDGIGIPAEHLSHVFDLFAQVERPDGRPRDGLGVGLTLVRAIAERHGGRVEAESEGPGRGSRFSLYLPLSRSETPKEESEAAPPRQSAARRVLVVDDAEDSVASMRMLLQTLGFEAHTAADGVEAIARAAELRPDVVLLDIGLPVFDGYEVCRRIRAEPWGGAMRIVAVTGWSQDEDRRRSAEAGFDEHLCKPVGIRDLRRVLSEPPREARAGREECDGARDRVTPSRPAAAADRGRTPCPPRSSRSE